MSLKKIENCENIIATIEGLKLSDDFLNVHTPLITEISKISPFPPRIEESGNPPESIKIIWEKGFYKIVLHLIANSLYPNSCDLERWHKFLNGYIISPLKGYPRRGAATIEDIKRYFAESDFIQESLEDLTN